ncbi:MAG: hypothetical protein IID45_04975 [Planctomycetes bacterium]|nr:hypothetical protein [Planctomycetota bacterium]
MSVIGHELKGPHFIVTSDGSLHGEDSDENRDIAQRIHACVNACDGITTEELESGVIQDMRRIIGQVIPLLQSQQPATQQKSPRRKITVENR